MTDKPNFTMLDSLRFVQGAVAHKDFVQALQHFHIKDRTIKGFNGMIGLCSPIDLDLDITPKADSFVKAIQTCEDTISLHMNPNGKLNIKSGKFKVAVECIAPETYPEIIPEGQYVELTSPLLPVFNRLYPFITEDASRPWARGILLRDCSAYATNNIILVEVWLGSPVPFCINIPKDAISELLRINEEPTHLQISENRITFHFAENRWLCTQTFSTEWPDLSKVLSVDSNPKQIPEDLFKALEDIGPFTDKMERVYLGISGIVSTTLAEDEGASVEVAGIENEGCYNYKHLLSIRSVAEKLDLSTYPAPCLFYGENLRGAVIGMRL